MARIRQTHASGKSRRSRNRDVNINSYNVDPDVIVATASGVIFQGNLGDFDYFVVNQDSADTDILRIPSNLDLGTSILLFAEEAFELGSELSSGVGINGGDDTATVSVSQGSVLELTRSSEGNWIGQEIDSTGSTGGGGGGGSQDLQSVLTEGAALTSNFNVTSNDRFNIACQNELRLSGNIDNDENAIQVNSQGIVFSTEEGDNITSMDNNGIWNFDGKRLLEIGAPVAGTDATNRNYVDAGDASDPKLKTIKGDLKSTLSFVEKTNPVRYDWKKKASPYLKGSDIGFTTSQFKKDFPELVKKDFDIDGESFERLDYRKTVAILWKAVQELSEEVTKLKTKK